MQVSYGLLSQKISFAAYVISVVTKMVGVQESRMVVYVRQENEEIYTPLHLVPPNVQAIRYTK